MIAFFKIYFYYYFSYLYFTGSIPTNNTCSKQTKQRKNKVWREERKGIGKTRMEVKRKESPYRLWMECFKEKERKKKKTITQAPHASSFCLFNKSKFLITRPKINFYIYIFLRIIKLIFRSLLCVQQTRDCTDFHA